MVNIPNEIKDLICKYTEQKGERPVPFNYDEWNSLAEYKLYLEKKLKES